MKLVKEGNWNFPCFLELYLVEWLLALCSDLSWWHSGTICWAGDQTWVVLCQARPLSAVLLLWPGNLNYFLIWRFQICWAKDLQSIVKLWDEGRRNDENGALLIFRSHFSFSKWRSLFWVLIGMTCIVTFWDRRYLPRLGRYKSSDMVLTQVHITDLDNQLWSHENTKETYNQRPAVVALQVY